jgi:hypothetical protein
MFRPDSGINISMLNAKIGGIRLIIGGIRLKKGGIRLIIAVEKGVLHS